MKIDASVELVTLSDSLTSPRPKPKLKSKNAEKGTTKVVCLDSDTDSDGSYTHTFANGGFTERTEKFGDSGCSPNACKQQNDSWLGLHKCANYRKSRIPRHSLSFGKEADTDMQTSFNAIDQYENYHGTSDSDLDFIKNKQDADIIPLVESDNLDKIVPLPGLDCKPNANHKDMQLSKGTTDSNLHSSFSPCTSQGIYVDNFYSHNNSMSSASPCHEVKCYLMPPINTHDVDAPKNHGTCLSSPSQELNDYTLPAWDDHLKGIISKLETSKAIMSVAVSPRKTFEQGSKIECSDHEDDDKDSGEYSFLKKNVGKRDAGDISDSWDSSSCKRHRKSLKGRLGGADSKPAGRTMGGSKSTARIVGVCRTRVRSIDDATPPVFDKDAEKLTKKEKQMKHREEREAKKQQLKEERSILRQEKQEEKRRQQELKKRRNEEEKKRKEELKVEAVERRKVEKEKEKWEKGKFALQNITALVDTQILEQGLIGGHLLTRFAEKGFKYHLVKNPVKKTVIWQMKLPSKESVRELQEDCQSQDSQEFKTSKKSGPQLSLENSSVSYVLIVLEADEFLEMITEGALDKHVRNLQKLYPGCTLCYLINKLMRHLHKREQQQYKNPGDNWIRPPVEQVLAKLVTSYSGVHSRLCVDEAEVSEHIVGLTRSLAECPFKRKLTPLSLSANGDHVVKNDPNNEAIKKDVWLKALVALPKVSGSCAVAIAKKYPSMSALFEAYLDPAKTVHEKEHLLEDLLKEGLLGGESNRRIGPTCSRRVYRILMAEQGNLHTDDVEEGADAFRD